MLLGEVTVHIISRDAALAPEQRWGLLDWNPDQLPKIPSFNLALLLPSLALKEGSVFILCLSSPRPGQTLFLIPYGSVVISHIIKLYLGSGIHARK